MTYLTAMAVLAAFVIFSSLLILEKILGELGRWIFMPKPKRGDPAASIQEMTCSSCSQKFPLDRHHCPYCSTPLKSYWFDENGEKKHATVFSEKGKDFLYYENKVLPLDDPNEIPPALRPYFADKMEKKVFCLSPFVLSGLLMFFVTVILLLPDALHPSGEAEKMLEIQSYSDLMSKTEDMMPSDSEALQAKPPSEKIPRGFPLFMGFFCLLYSILGLITGRVWSRYRPVYRSEDPVYFHFLIITQFLFCLWFSLGY